MVVPATRSLRKLPNLDQQAPCLLAQRSDPKMEILALFVLKALVLIHTH